MERHVLIVFPHPDDESYTVSGTAAYHLHNGTPVTYACLTMGQLGRNLGNPPFANRVTLPTVRRGELEASCAAIGITDVRALGFHDKMIEFEDRELLDGKLRELIEELNPSLILTFHPEYSVHPDHDACGAAVVRVVEAMKPKDRPKVHVVAFAKGHERALGPADVHVDITLFLEQKIGSIKAHKSQFHTDPVFEGLPAHHPTIRERFASEKFWTYKFDTHPKK
ncbi:bacillithiol biosynthesis deacetylase BshB2 [Saccharibacillus endophyticus]|uniref:Bacillithiol biosynthesis deacetylase BshB2 n=1 Tax=Saccharibacillus endophyticus TaxID=2060666 RepID=A0ABQ1ZYZ5_9BACL|nr:bacillithiol biosynthesis deacetylase BshB2 [Saccharibacillus endophyticus]GGH82838.1 bacillithiol biosynthesis deacetylase BshB2 [Saccharibacillus endophyticus]